MEEDTKRKKGSFLNVDPFSVSSNIGKLRASMAPTLERVSKISVVPEGKPEEVCTREICVSALILEVHVH